MTHSLNLTKRLTDRAQESWKVFLDHGLHFIEQDIATSAKNWVQYLLQHRKQKFGTIELLLHRQGKDGCPIQDVEKCLPFAIRGFQDTNRSDLAKVLKLLIENGADVYAEDISGRSTSQLACCQLTWWSRASDHPPHLQDFVMNRDLALKEIWTDVLTECGYNAEEVISASSPIEGAAPVDARIEELIDTRLENPSSDSDDLAAATSYDPYEDMEELNSGIRESLDRNTYLSHHDTASQMGRHFTSHEERHILEGDAEVWGN